jgi:hypothetical protein
MEGSALTNEEIQPSLKPNMMLLQALTFLPFLRNAAVIGNRPNVLGMNASSFCSLLWSLVESRQFGSPFGTLGGLMGDPKPPATTKKLSAKYPSAVRVANTYGPLTLNPKDVNMAPRKYS